MSQNTIMQPLHVVLGASGGAGLAILKELIAQGKNVRGVNSSGKKPSGVNVEFIKADAANLEELETACEGASYIYNALNVQYSKWLEILPIFTKNVIAVSSKNGAKLIYIDNLYAYGPVNESMTEATPQLATDLKGKLRAELADIYLEAHKQSKIKVLVIRAPDFFGPNTQSMIGDTVFKKAIKNQAAQNIGDPDKLHSYIYIDDYAKAVVLLASNDTAYGEIWHAPSNPAIKTRNIINLVYKQLGFESKISNLNKFTMFLLSPFIPILKEVTPLYYQRDRDYIVDHSKFDKAFGIMKLTPLDEAVSKTIEWYQQNN